MLNKRLKMLAMAGFGIAVASALSIARPDAAHAQDKTVRIGFQKYGKLVLLKSKGSL